MYRLLLLLPLIGCASLEPKTGTTPTGAPSGTATGGGTGSGATGTGTGLGSGTSTSAPVANDDADTVVRGAFVDLSPLANDTDPDDAIDPATVAIVTDPAAGTVQISPAGNVRYSHDGSAGASDSFEYTVDDVVGQTSNIATVTLTIEEPPAGVCQLPSVEVARAPGGDMMLCDDPNDSTCEEDFGQFCPLGWHLCTTTEFNERNAGWTQPTDTYARALGVIYCRLTGGAGHFTVPDSSSANTDLGQDEVFNCYYGSSTPACTTGYGCNEMEAMALCCADAPLCGNGVVDSPSELCDDGNQDDFDDCLTSCTWREPQNHGFSGTNCN